MADLQLIIDKLEAWSEATGGFHEDRQLADEVLIADGWRVVPDSAWEGGIRWSWGTGPEVSMSEGTRSHPINDLNTAVAVVPFRCAWSISVVDGVATARVWGASTEAQGQSERPSVAILIAAMRFKAATGT